MNWMFLPLKRYAEFSGRSRPQEFWMFFLLQLLIYIGLSVVTFVIAGGIAGLTSAGSGDSTATSAGLVGMFATLGIFALVFLLVALVFFVPNLAVSARRLHDTGKSGWWQLIYWVPWLLGIVVSVLNASASAGSLDGPSAGLTLLSLAMSGLQLLALLVLIIFYVLPGTPGPNQYGPDPLAAERERMGVPPGYGQPHGQQPYGQQPGVQPPREQPPH